MIGPHPFDPPDGRRVGSPARACETAGMASVPLSTAEVLALLRRAADDMVRPRFGQLASSDVIEKTPGDFVTIADREAEAFLTQVLTRHYPDAVIVGEESSFLAGSGWSVLATAPHAFVIDPVDGTNNYVRGNADYAIMLAELRAGEVIRSWIWQPEHAVAFVAEQGRGVWHNGVRVTSPSIQEPPRGATSRRTWWGSTAGGRLAPIVPSRFCVGVDYPRMMLGDLDFLVYRHPKPWDHLPALLMLHELGGDIRYLDGTPYTPGSHGDMVVCCCASQLGDRLVDVLGQPGGPTGADIDLGRRQA